MPTSLPVSRKYHRKPIRLLNTLWRGAMAVGIGRVSLDENELLDTAMRQTGLEDFGDPRFREPMSLILQGLENEADLNPAGRFLARSSMLRLLKHRLYAEDLFKRHPEILARKIPPSVAIVGLGRSGTTRLHRLMAADDRFLHLKAWESVNPVPLPESFAARDAGKTDPRITSIEQGLKAVLYMSPQVNAVHPLGTHEVEEEIGLIQHAFSTQLFECINYLPGFAEWLMTHDQKYAYEYMVKLLKLVSWYRNDPEDKPWIFKTPQYMQDLDGLLHVMPDVRVICPHRDPIKVTGSLCSMTWNSIVRDTDSMTSEWVGPYWLDKVERMLDKTQAIRETQLPAENQYDVLYADITADWRQAMVGIYDFLGMPLTDAAVDGMQAWLDSNAQHKHGAHKYKLEDFGLTVEEVDRRLMGYRERYNIPYETRNPHRKTA